MSNFLTLVDVLRRCEAYVHTFTRGALAGTLLGDIQVALLQAEQKAERDAKLAVLVDRQSEDAGLWFEAQTAAEAYLQQELRKLHAMIESADA